MNTKKCASIILPEERPDEIKMERSLGNQGKQSLQKCELCAYFNHGLRGPLTPVSRLPCIGPGFISGFTDCVNSTS